MKVKVLFFFFICISITAMSWTISGVAEPLKNSKIYFRKVDFTQKNDKLDSCVVDSKGQFVYTSDSADIVECKSKLGTSFYICALSNEYIKTQFVDNSWFLSGSPHSQLALEYEQYRKKDYELNVSSTYESGNVNLYKLRYTEHRRKLQNWSLTHLYQSPAVYIASQRWLLEENFLNDMYQKIDSTQFPPNIWHRIKNQLNRLKANVIGASVTMLYALDSIGQRQSTLNACKDTWCYVDFWASWCRPCRIENKKLVFQNQLLASEPIRFVSISIDDSFQSWKTALKRDKMPWSQYIGEAAWKSEAAVQAGISAIPSNLLIEPNGKIVARNFPADSLSTMLFKILGK